MPCIMSHTIFAQPAYNEADGAKAAMNLKGSNAMTSFTINMRNFTQAEKARAFLARSGIRSMVRRTTGRGGCTFSLMVTGGADKGEVCRLLSQIGVSCDIS